MKDTNINSKVLLIQMSRFLIQFMELANRIDEEDYKTIVLIAQKMDKSKKGVRDHLERANLFMRRFFLRQMIEDILHTDDSP